MTYAEYLKQNGATEDEIKILDVPASRKVFEKMQADTAAAQAAAQAATEAQARFKQETDAWYNDQILPNYTKMEREAAAAKANEARAVALIKASQDEGLRKVATDMGYGEVVKDAAAPTPPAFDPSKYIPRDELNGLMDRAGEGLAALEDMVMEHRQLFPDKPLSVRELRREAVAAKMTAYDYWEKKYKVPEARSAADTARQEARDNAIRKEAEDKVRAELASQYGNPNTSPVVPSVNPFAARTSDASRTKQPWEDGDRTNLRVERVMKVLGSQQTKAN
jgi:hypothetical protein